MQADLDIWAYCHKTVAKAGQYTGIMAHSCSDPAALEVLIRRADNDIPVSPLRKLLVQAMQEYLRKGEDFLLDRQRSSTTIWPSGWADCSRPRI
ncbi:hypothetical protein ACFPTY_19995 [Halomonas beimenensis]|uniref:hypothetical protein n=1 Tax=Halomonas beimenensis TaxID=475662 RepID=UPI003606A988